MSWSYDSSDLTEDTASGRRNIVRFTIGDTDSSWELLSNEEIAYLLSKHGDSTRRASMAAINRILASFARMVDTWMGHTRIECAQRFRNYRQLLEQLEKEVDADSVIDIHASGISIDEKDTLDADTDLPQPGFRVGQDDIAGPISLTPSRLTGD